MRSCFVYTGRVPAVVNLEKYLFIVVVVRCFLVRLTYRCFASTHSLQRRSCDYHCALSSCNRICRGILNSTCNSRVVYRLFDVRTFRSSEYSSCAGTYVFVRSSLKVKFHAHLNSMEESLGATRRERSEVESLTRQLETGRTKITLELQARQAPETSCA